VIKEGRVIYPGKARGVVVKCDKPVVILGDIDPKRGTVEGCGAIKDRIFVFPRGAGSTVGSYTLYALKFHGTAPRGMIVEEAEPIVVAGAIIAEIPTVDGVSIEDIPNGAEVEIHDGKVVIL